MKVLIVGGTRFIGRATAERLVEMGHTVAVFHRGETHNPLPDSVTHFYGDTADLDDHRDTFADFAPDAIVHTNLMEQGDATAMMRVFRGITERVVVVSSVDVYRAWGRLLNTEPGTPDRVPLTEISPLREERYPYRNTLIKDWRYYYDKIHVEQVAMKIRHPAATVVRLPMVYGEYDYQQRIAGYLQRMDDGRDVILIDRRAANWQAPRAYVGDVAEALALATTHEKGADRIYHMAEPAEIALTELNWVQKIGQVAGWEGRVVAVEPEHLPSAMKLNTHGQHITLDINRITNELGYHARFSRAEALYRTITWDRKHTLPNMKPVDYRKEDAIIQKLNL